MNSPELADGGLAEGTARFIEEVDVPLVDLGIAETQVKDLERMRARESTA